MKRKILLIVATVVMAPIPLFMVAYLGTMFALIVMNQSDAAMLERQCLSALRIHYRDTRVGLKTRQRRIKDFFYFLAEFEATEVATGRKVRFNCTHQHGCPLLWITTNGRPIPGLREINRRVFGRYPRPGECQ